MSTTIDTARSLLIGAARERFANEQQRQELLTGKPAITVPSDSALIAASPPLAQQLQALEFKQNEIVNYNRDASVANVEGAKVDTSPSDSGSGGGTAGSVNINASSLTPAQVKQNLNITA